MVVEVGPEIEQFVFEIYSRPSVAGQLGAGFATPMLYVPALFWMHLLAFWLLLRPMRAAAPSADAPMSLAATE